MWRQGLLMWRQAKVLEFHIFFKHFDHNYKMLGKNMKNCYETAIVFSASTYIHIFA